MRRVQASFHDRYSTELKLIGSSGLRVDTIGAILKWPVIKCFLFRLPLLATRVGRYRGIPGYLEIQKV